MPEDNKTIEFDFDSAVPVNASDPEARIPSPDFDFESAVPVTEDQETIPQMLLQNAKEAGMETLAMVGKVASVIRWPFWRFIEHPVSTVVAGIQEPEGKTVGGVLSKAGQAFVPFKKIPKDEYGTYGEVWGNYYQSVLQLKGYAKDEVPTPEWYKFIASYGSAMGVETPVLSGASKVATAIATRAATAEEASAIRDNFKPLKDYLESRSVKTESLHKEGNIIKINDTQEIFINKNLTAVLSGGEIRIPRFAKVKNLPTKNVPSVNVAGAGIVPTKGAVVSGVAPTVPVPPITNNLIDINKALEVSEDSVKAIVEQAGGKFVGLSEDKSAVMFNTRGGGTKQVDISELSVDSVKAKIKEFEDAGGRTVPETLAQLNERLSKTSQPVTASTGENLSVMPERHLENIKPFVWNDIEGLKSYKKDLENDFKLIPEDKEISQMLMDVELRIKDLQIAKEEDKFIQTQEGQSGKKEDVLIPSAVSTPTAATPPAQPPIEPPSGVTAVSPENRPPEYIQNRKTYTGGKKSNTIMEDVKKLSDKLFVPLSTRLAEVNPKLMYALRKHIFDINKNNDTAIKPLKEFATKANKLTEADFKDLDIALKNKDTAVIDEIVNRNGMSKEFGKLKDILSDIYNRSKEAGVELGYIEQYWPRRVSDVKGYMDFLRGKDNWTVIERELLRESDKLGRALAEEEQAYIADQVLRGYGTDKITVSKPSNIKARKIDTITPEMNVYYKDSLTALSEYVDAMNNRIEVNKFFGIGKNVDESIGKYVNDLIKEGMINATQEREVSAVLKSYFGKVGTGPLISAYRNLAYVYTMGSPIAALTQVQDMAYSLAFNGYYETGKALLSKSRIKKEDIYIHDIASEFNSEGATAKMVRTTFKYIGLEKLDSLGKSVYISAAFGRLSKQAKNNKIKYNLDEIFGVGKGEHVRQDLINKKLTQDTKFLIFSELLDVQPAALSELPAQYVSGGNGRIFYQLKTYSLKQIDVYHRKVFKEFKTDPRQAMKNLMALTTALVALGVGIDSIKDTILGRKIRITDTVADNIFKLFGFSRYMVYKAKDDGIGSAALRQILPPIGFIDDIYKDVADMTKEDSEFELKDSRILSGIPLVGKFYYWWYGKGKTIEEKRIDKEFEN